MAIENGNGNASKATKPKRTRSAMIPNPWDGGKMTLREYYEREEKEREIDHGYRYGIHAMHLLSFSHYTKKPALNPENGAMLTDFVSMRCA